MIDYAIRMSVINNMSNPNSRLCYWHDTHFHIRIIFQTISVIILPLTTLNIINKALYRYGHHYYQCHGFKVKYYFGSIFWFQLVCTIVFVAETFVLYLLLESLFL